jgi:nicotinate-nucleotide pyrophosphorylase
MKTEITFTLTTSVEADSFDEAEALARIKADAIIIQTLQATGYRLKYIPSALSLQPEITEQWKKTIDLN